jgi:hypothetical protein
MTLESPTTGHVSELESTFLLLKFGGKLRQLGLNLLDGLLSELGEHLSLKRRVGDHDDRFQGTP